MPRPFDRRGANGAVRSGDGERRRRRARLFVIVALAAVSLSACNSSHLSVPTVVVPPPPGCDTSRVVVVGASLDLSGPGAWLGREYLTGLELGIAKVNSGGGVPPRNTCLELAYKNNGGSPAVDDQAMLDLVNVERAGVVVGGFLGSSTARYLGSLGVPAISLSDLEDTFEPRGFPNTFPMTASMRSQAFVIASELKKRRITSVGLVVTDDSASELGGEYLASLSSADGFVITDRQVVSPSGATAATAVSRVRATHPAALVVIDDTGAVGPVLSARAALGWKVPAFAGPDATETGVLRVIAGATAGVSVVVPTGALAGSGLASAGTYAFRSLLLRHLHTSSLRGSIIPYAETYDAMTMIGSAAVGSMGVAAVDLTSFLQNANYDGVLASYTYTAGAHTGVAASNQAVVPLDTLSNGLLREVGSS
ncbi:MAG: ABC transporter substrate-binding protein [Acidimicrobiales bacterium]